jgi:hypothetical protein
MLNRSVESQGGEDLDFIRNQLSSVNDETLSFTQSFSEFMRVAATSTDMQMNVLERNFPAFSYLLGEYGDNAMFIAEKLESIGLTGTDNIQEAAQLLGEVGFQSAIQSVEDYAKIYEETLSVSRETALSMA